MPKFLKHVAVAMGGALISYLFDADRGKGRRARLRDQTTARLRDVQEAIRRRGKYEAGRMKGLVERLTPDEPPELLDDAALRQKIKSELIGPAQLTDVDVEVRDGIVTVVGSMESDEYHRLAGRIADLPGVESLAPRRDAHETADRES